MIFVVVKEEYSLLLLEYDLKPVFSVLLQITLWVHSSQMPYRWSCWKLTWNEHWMLCCTLFHGCTVHKCHNNYNWSWLDIERRQFVTVWIWFEMSIYCFAVNDLMDAPFTHVLTIITDGCCYIDRRGMLVTVGIWCQLNIFLIHHELFSWV